MTRWVQATLEVPCGGAAHSVEAPRWIRKGEWCQETRMPLLKRAFIRCADCAGPAPKVLTFPSAQETP